MKKIRFTVTAFALIAFIGCNEKKSSTEELTEVEPIKEVIKEAPKSISFSIESKSESGVSGKGVFSEVDGIVTFEAKFMGLTPGSHAIHIHEKADCSSPDGKSSGGHWNPTLESHGKWGAVEGYHKGDIGNFDADEYGNGRISMETDEWCIGCGDVEKDVMGKAIIVHQGVDDFTTQPTGDAGGRVSCGGIVQ